MTYDYFLKLVETNGIGKAIEKAISSHKSTDTYQAAKISNAYFEKQNPTIMQFQKMLHKVNGGAIPDIYSANYKMRTLWYQKAITQLLNYLLGNGCNFNTDVKDKLGRQWDSRVMEAAKYAAIHGRAFTFWNRDHAEVFHYLDTDNEAGFCPLYDKSSGGLAAGIRYWYERDEDSGNKVYLACTLYEPDGLTEFATDKNSHDLIITAEKTGYITTITTNAIGMTTVTTTNYSSFPIKELRYNSARAPMLEGHRETIDTYDMIFNGFANTVDETAEIFWILKGFGGMDDELDLAKARDHLHRLHMASVGDGEGITATTVNIPVEAREALLERIRASFYENFQIADMKALSAAQKTTQEIKAAFTAQDNLANDIEFHIIDHIQDVLEVAGLQAEPSFQRQLIINESERTNSVLAAANYLPEDMIPKLLPFLTPEQAEKAAQYAMDMDIQRVVNAHSTNDEEEMDSDSE